MDRFAGTVQELGPVDAESVAQWIESIPLEEWPQQAKVDDQLRPAMVNDPAWHRFGMETDGLVDELMQRFPGCIAGERMLSTVMPGHQIDPHADIQPPEWRARVHVPLQTNPQAWFWSVATGASWCMKLGMAYLVNTETLHAIRNEGQCPRIHFMLDVREC